MFGSISYTQTMVWKILFYHTKRGESPVEEFIRLLDATTYAKVIHTIDILAAEGPFLKPPYIKKLLPGLYELRIKSQIAIRIFYSSKDKVYYLLHVFKKKTQKTPKHELKIAVDRMKELI